MTNTGRVYALVGNHAENLHSGAMIAPTECVTEAMLDPADQWLIDEGRLVLLKTPKSDKAKGDD